MCNSSLSPCRKKQPSNPTLATVTMHGKPVKLSSKTYYGTREKSDSQIPRKSRGGCQIFFPPTLKILKERSWIEIKECGRTHNWLNPSKNYGSTLVSVLDGTSRVGAGLNILNILKFCSGLDQICPAFSENIVYKE